MKTGILLGGGITQSCELHTDPQSRADKALELLKLKKIDKLILSGKYSFGKRDKTEAQVFKEYLVSKGADAKKLILEEDSRDTLGNAIFSKRKCIQLKLPKDIILITSDYHMRRSMMIFNKVFGPEYKIKPESSHPVLRRLKLLKLIEWKKRMINTSLLAGVKNGDHERIWRRMGKFIPMYKNMS